MRCLANSAIAYANTNKRGGSLDGSTRQQSRITGIDLARLIAIVGMVMVHFGPNPVPETTLGSIYGLSHGRASILFVFLAGIGATFLSSGASGTGRFSSTAQILSRAAILLPLGLWLQDLDHGVLVILQYYAIYFVFAAALVRLPGALVISVALAFFAIGPIVYHLAEFHRPEWFATDASTLGDPPAQILRDTLISGSYPLVTWGAPLSFGIWVGRQNLRQSATRVTLMLVGVAAIIASSKMASAVGEFSLSGATIPIGNGPHSQTHLWLLDATGTAIVVTVLSLELANRLPNLTWPLVAGGQLALTIYVGHLLLLHEYSHVLRRGSVNQAFASVGIFITIAIGLCALWRSYFSRGPLEAVFRLPSWIVERFR
jgi:uncharacterized membrane protein